MEKLVEQYMEADLVQLRLDEDVITPGQGRSFWSRHSVAHLGKASVWNFQIVA
jgi:hypothetical protein